MSFKDKLQAQRIQARFKRDMKKQGIQITGDDDYIRLVPVPQTFQYKYPEYFEDEVVLETTYSHNESVH